MPNNQPSDNADTKSESQQSYSYTMQNLVFDRNDADLFRQVFAGKDGRASACLPSMALEDNRDKHMPSATDAPQQVAAPTDAQKPVAGPGDDLSLLVKGEMEYLNEHPELIDIYKKTGLKIEDPRQHKETEPNLVPGPDGKLHLKDAPIAPVPPTAPYKASDEHTHGHRPDPTKGSGEIHGGDDQIMPTLDIEPKPSIIEAIKENKLAPSYDRGHLRYPSQKSW